MPKPLFDEHQLVTAAIEFASQRIPSGEVVAAAAACRSGAVLQGIWCDGGVDAACLCAETGPICQAHANDDPLVASVCVARENGTSPFRILPACGICQERLAFWGLDVMIGVPGARVHGIGDFISLRDLRPHFWRDCSP